LEAKRTIERIENLTKMKDSLKAQLGLGNQAWFTRNELLDLRNIGKIQAYIKEFTWLMLDIKDILKEGIPFHFMNFLHPWAQSEL